MLSKCIGIISWFPDDEIKRKARKESFLALLKTLDTYFKLPIVIVAQNWRDEDFELTYCDKVIIYKYDKLGIVGARNTLRTHLLQLNYDYNILMDDDTDIICNQNGVENYLNEIDNHPNMVGLFRGNWLRLFAISNHMLKIMNFDYIKNLDPTRGEIWEDTVWVFTFQGLYPNSFFRFSRNGIDEKFIPSEKNPTSTWYKPEFNQNAIFTRSLEIKNEWIAHERAK